MRLAAEATKKASPGIIKPLSGIYLV